MEGKEALTLGAIFSMYHHNGLSNLGRGPSKEHFCQIILESVQCPVNSDKEIFKIFYIDI